MAELWLRFESSGYPRGLYELWVYITFGLMLRLMVDLIINSSTTHTLLFFAPIILGLILRAARLPGAAVVGGVLAGILLGPSLLGRMLPQEYEQLFVGGIAERDKLDAMTSRQQADLIAARLSGFDLPALWNLEITHTAERKPLVESLEQVRWTHQRPLRSYMALLIVMTLLGVAKLGVGATDRPRGWSIPLSIGLWSVLLPGGLIYAAMVYWWKFDPLPALLTAAALGIGPAVMAADDQQAADQTEYGGARMMQTAGRFASLLALLTVFGVLWRQNGGEAALWGLPLTALLLGWLITPISASNQSSRKRVRLLIHVLLIPPLAAAASMKIDLFAHFFLWPCVVVVLLSGDGRWLGALGGALTLGGRRGLRTMRLVMGSVSCGVTQLAVTAVAVHTNALPPEIIVGLVFGAVYMEISAPLRTKMSSQILELEET